MNWRDFYPCRTGTHTPTKGHFEDFEDIGLNKTKKSSSSYKETDSEILNLEDTSSISSKPEEPSSPALPLSPLSRGWLVAYRDQTGRIRGGCDEREAGTVQDCQWDGNGWIVLLANGESVGLQSILSVAQTDTDGRVTAAWTIREHGYDGKDGLVES